MAGLGIAVVIAVGTSAVVMIGSIDDGSVPRRQRAAEHRRTGDLERAAASLRRLYELNDKAWVTEEEVREASTLITQIEGAGQSAPRIDVAEGAWLVRRSTSPIDDSETIVVSRSAKNMIRAWPGENHRPTLTVQWLEGALSCYITTYCQAHVEDMYQQHTTTIRLDGGSATTIKMHSSTDGESLFFPDARSIVRSMAQSQKLTFRFTPFTSRAQIVTFDLVGLDEAIEPIEAARGLP